MDKALQREQARLRKQRQRDKESVTSGSVTESSVTLAGSEGGSVTSDRRTLMLAKSLIDPIKRSKLILISKALDKKMTGLDGKSLVLSELVRYGIRGWTFTEIKELLI